MTKANINWNVNQIVKGMTNGTIRFDNAIQRGYVWDKKRASLLIDSVLREYPVPPIFTIRTEEKITVKSKEVSVYDCIDGKQRSTTFKLFMENAFKLEGLEPIILADGSEIDINGKTFEELDEEMQDAIKSYSLTVYYFSDITDDEVAEMMSRLNNGKVLTGTESARIKAKQLDTIKKLASHNLFTNHLTEKAIKGYVNEDIVIKFALLLSDQTELSNKNVREAYETYSFGESTCKSITDTMDFTLEAIEESTDDKKIIKRMTSKANLITILYVAHEYLVNGNSDVSEFADRLAEFFNGTEGATISADYNDACTNGTMRATNVITRNDEFLNYVMGE
jgi:hypothetical protein